MDWSDRPLDRQRLMGRQLKFTHPAEPNTRYAPGCFDARIGDSWPIQLEDGTKLPAKLVAANIASDGQSVQFTIEVEGPPPERQE